MTTDIDSMSLEQCRSAAQQILDNCPGDLTGQDAEYFEALTERAEQLVETRDRSAALVRRYQAGALRSEGGSVGGHHIHERDETVHGREHFETRSHPLLPSPANLAKLEEARRTLTSMSVIEERAALKTTDFGTATVYGPGSLAGPRTLYISAGIPSISPNGYAGVVPQFSLPSGGSLASEGNAHGEFDDVSPDTVTIARAGAWSDLSSESMLSTALGEITGAHARIIARALDVATVEKLEQSPSVMGIDEALMTVAAEAAVDVSGLWIVGDPGGIAELAGNATFTPTNGPDVGSYAVAYGGARIYPTPAATPGLLTVFDPASFRVFVTGLASAIVNDPKTGGLTLGQWQFYGIGQLLVGSAVTVDLGSGGS